MNCKPGDLAMIVKGTKHIGRLVEVIHLAPMQVFKLPDGVLHNVPKFPDCWVCRSFGSPFTVNVTNGRNGRKSRLAMYGVIPDYALKPLPGTPEDEEVEHEEVATV